MAETPPLLALEGITKRFGEHEVLKEVSLGVRQGEVVAIIGASGSGKSTLLRCVNLLEQPSGGSMTFDGERYAYDAGGAARIGARRLRALRTHIGMVFQQYNLWPHLSVLENIVEAPLRVQGRPKGEVVAEALRLLERIGLADKRDAYPSRLSGGQQQRVAIVRALAMRPRLMLFDEVTSALDPELVGEVLDLMAELAAEGMTMLLVTHEIAFAREVSHRTVFVDQGLIAAQGPSRELLSNPEGDRMRAFLRRVLHAATPAAAGGEPRL